LLWIDIQTRVIKMQAVCRFD